MTTSRTSRLAGRLVQVSEQPGRRPLVLVLSGCGVPSVLWRPVVELLARRHVVLLDRPGLGTPWPGTLPRLAEEVATIAELIERVGGPVVLVAHSMAGPHAEALVRGHPDRVAGLVLVDSSVEWGLPRAGAVDAVARTTWRQLARLVRRTGGLRPARALTRAVARLVVVRQSRLGLLDPVPGLAALAEPEAAASVVAEQGAYRDQLRDLDRVRAERPWPGTPTTVLTARAGGGARLLADQGRLASLLHATLVVVEDARHLMMIDSPSSVAAAVWAVVEEEPA